MARQTEIGGIDVAQQFVRERHILCNQRFYLFQIGVGLVQSADQTQHRQLVGLNSHKLEQAGLGKMATLKVIEANPLAQLKGMLVANVAGDYC